MATSPSTHQFPDWFPQSCPPFDATDADGVVYRFATKSPVAAEDFLSHHELGLAPRAQACRRCSLSLYRTLAAARRKLRELRDRSPERFGPHIAEGNLSAAHGKIKQEGSDPDHHEWWAYEDVVRHAAFRIVETVQS